MTPDRPDLLNGPLPAASPVVLSWLFQARWPLSSGAVYFQPRPLKKIIKETTGDIWNRHRFVHLSFFIIQHDDPVFIKIKYTRPDGAGFKLYYGFYMNLLRNHQNDLPILKISKQKNIVIFCLYGLIFPWHEWIFNPLGRHHCLNSRKWHKRVWIKAGWFPFRTEGNVWIRFNFNNWNSLSGHGQKNLHGPISIFPATESWLFF